MIMRWLRLTHWQCGQKVMFRDYINRYNVPYNALHDKGFPSIGCAPCTRAIKDGEDDRAGRWWWEESVKKECGLHVDLKDKDKDKGIKS
jgi:3''-phosphoadenosine 5''-phosphosulfate sulfotransferase (PAPS reductase)/FAD synthetase and related enzymes